MTKQANQARAAVTNARVLLATMVEAGWATLHLTVDGCDYAIGQAAVPHPTAPPDAAEILLRAPHLATVSALAAQGSTVRAGGTLATLSLLDEEIPLLAEADCTILRNIVGVGDLVGYDDPILVYAATPLPEADRR